MQFSFKKTTQGNANPMQPPVSARQHNPLPQTSNREVQPNNNGFGGFGDTETKNDNDFLSFDFNGKKPTTVQSKPTVQQRTNHSQMNFGWNNPPGPQAKHDPFADASEVLPAPSPNINKPQPGLNNSGVKNPYSRSPMDKGLSFNFNFAENNGSSQQSKPQGNANSNSKFMANPQSVRPIDPFDDFLNFGNPPTQQSKPAPIVNNPPNANFDGFGFAVKNVPQSPFEDFGFAQKQPNAFTDNSRPEQSRPQNDNFNFGQQPQNMKSSFGNFNQPQQHVSAQPQPVVEAKPQAFVLQPAKIVANPVSINYSNQYNPDPFINEFANHGFNDKHISVQQAEEVDPFKADANDTHWNHQQNDTQPVFEQQNYHYANESDPFSKDDGNHQITGNAQHNLDLPDYNANQNFGIQDHMAGGYQSDPFQTGGVENDDNFNQGGSGVHFQNPNGFNNPVAFKADGFDNFGAPPEKKVDSNQFGNFGFGN